VHKRGYAVGLVPHRGNLLIENTQLAEPQELGAGATQEADCEWQGDRAFDSRSAEGVGLDAHGERSLQIHCFVLYDCSTYECLFSAW